jgi:drug/metabolite transporter (DMT)-like permease
MPALAIRLSDRPYLLLVLTMLMWGGNAVASRLAVGELSPMVLTCFRWLFACAVLAPVARAGIIRDWPKLRPQLVRLTLLGTFGFTLFNALFYMAAHYTTAINITILQGSMPALVLLGMLAIYRMPITKRQAAGLVTTLIGVATLASGGSLETLLGLRLNHGDLMILAACVLYSGYTIAMRSKPDVSPLSLFCVIALAAFISSMPLVAAEVMTGQVVWPHSLLGWGLLAYVAVFPSALAQVYFIRAIEIIGPGRAGLFINLVPVFGALLAVLILGESFGLHHALALLLVIGGILLAESARRQEQPIALES